MLIAVWIATGVLALANLVAGIGKLVTPYDKLRTQMAWVEDFDPRVVKTIGGFEVLGAIGIVVPVATGILPILTPIAAVGIALIQLGAAVTHIRRREWLNLIANLVLLALAIFIAIARFSGV